MSCRGWRSNLEGSKRFISSPKRPDWLSIPTTPPIQWISTIFAFTVNDPGSEPDHSHSTSADVKNERAIPPHPLTTSWRVYRQLFHLPYQKAKRAKTRNLVTSNSWFGINTNIRSVPHREYTLCPLERPTGWQCTRTLSLFENEKNNNKANNVRIT